MSREEPAPQRASAPVVLIVDDDEMLRLLMRAALERDGIDVVEAADGLEAIERFDGQRVDLLIVDALMPRMDGFALCQALRDRPDGLYLPVLMVTGLEDIPSINRAYMVGATDFISKPINWLILSQRVLYMLRASQAFNELRMANRATEMANQQLNLLERIAAAANRTTSVQDAFAFALREVCLYMDWTVGHVYRLVECGPEDAVEGNGDRGDGVRGDGGAGIGCKSTAIWFERDTEHSAPFRAVTEQSVVETGIGLLGRVMTTATPAWSTDASTDLDPSRLAVAQRCRLAAVCAFPVLVQGTVSAIFEFFAPLPPSSETHSPKPHPAKHGPPDPSILRLMVQIGAQLTSVAERAMAEERLLHQAKHDALTGLPNRLMFLDRLKLAHEHARRDANYFFAVIFIDLDQFKRINDSLGHQAGDRLLIQVAERLAGLLRGVDVIARGAEINATRNMLATRDMPTTRDTRETRNTLARMGGDEFTALLDHLRHPSDAVRVAERIETALVEPFAVDDREIYCAASMGIAIGGVHYAASEEVLRDADIAMYRAKSLGKGRYEMFDQVMHTAAIERLSLENDLRRAVHSGEFIVYYQPIVLLETERIVGFEALVRWSRPGSGLVSPLQFIGVAEETGLIIPIGQWVLSEACKTVRAWQQAFPASNPLTISVNLSARQFDHPDLVMQITDVLQETGFDPSSLRLEITESVTMRDVGHAIDVLKQLRGLGIRISLDDFGTGYSSLSLLHRLPFDILKIDRSFVMTIDVDEESRNIVRTIKSLAQTLGMAVVAEGAERAAQSAELRALGCEYCQGYLYSRPVDETAIWDMLTTAALAETKHSGGSAS